MFKQLTLATVAAAALTTSASAGSIYEETWCEGPAYIKFEFKKGKVSKSKPEGIYNYQDEIECQLNAHMVREHIYDYHVAKNGGSAAAYNPLLSFVFIKINKDSDRDKDKWNSGTTRLRYAWGAIDENNGNQEGFDYINAWDNYRQRAVKGMNAHELAGYMKWWAHKYW